MNHDHAQCSHGGDGDVATDPVCGMEVTVAGAEHVAEHDGERHYFCSAGCREKFVADPAHYLSGAHRQAAEDVPEGTIYTCPMHPEVRQVGPGSCPICGMALELDAAVIGRRRVRIPNWSISPGASGSGRC